MRSWVIYACAMLSCATGFSQEVPKTGTQEPGHLEATMPVTIDYLLYLPDDYDQKVDGDEKKWPLVLFLHGAGERGDDLEKVKIHGPPKLVAEGKSFPFILVSPQCPDNRWWDSWTLTALLDKMEAELSVDPDRIYVTGLSMGGFGTWSLAAHTPERFAAIAPICGGGEPFQTRNFAKTPTWVFHGAKDNVIPLDRSESMVEAMKRVGGEPKFTIYADASHDSWTETYNNPEFYEWMLQQVRNKPEDPEKDHYGR